MKTVSMFRVLVALALLCAFGSTVPHANAQRETVRIRKVTAVPVKTPEYTIRGSAFSQPRVRDWLQISVEYETSEDWTDELEFTFHVLLKGRDAKADPFSLLNGSISYINVQKDRKLMAVMYVHPSIMTRFGSMEGVAVEVKQNGRPVAVDGTGNWQPWQTWLRQLSPKAGFVMRPDQTPFAVAAGDDYEMVKPVTR
ncbi:MAG: Amuc_1102 family pilus-like protein [Kiritimatiellia bacterium]|nr:Amuc_1102 family pilus-like protein [Kiritimatiellia bacterium]